MKITEQNIFSVKISNPGIRIPLYIESVSAGFPSPAQDYVERSLDLNELCIRNAAATFFVRVDGESMREGGIQSGDILVVDRSIQPKHKDIVIAILDGAFTVKCLCTSPSLSLVPLNKDFAPVEISQDSEMEIFGVVTFVIHQVKNR